MNAVVRMQPDGAIVPAVQSETATVLAIIERAASNPEVDIEKLERLMAMRERMEAAQQRQAFDQAMATAQSQMKRIEQDKKNSQTGSMYASFAAMDRALRPIYSDAGFSLSFDTADAPAPDMVRLTCTVAHSGGHRETKHIDMPADGKGAKGNDVMTKTHATGSAVTYGRRYLLGMIFNIAVGLDPIDDDGNAAGAAGEAAEKRAKSEARAADFIAEINRADLVGLERIGKEVPAAALPGDLATKVRDAFTARRTKLRSTT